MFWRKRDVMVCQCKCIERHMQSMRSVLEDDETRGRSVLFLSLLVIVIKWFVQYFWCRIRYVWMRDESDNPTTQMSGQDDTFQRVLAHLTRRAKLLVLFKANLFCPCVTLVMFHCQFNTDNAMLHCRGHSSTDVRPPTMVCSWSRARTHWLTTHN